MATQVDAVADVDLVRLVVHSENTHNIKQLEFRPVPSVKTWHLLLVLQLLTI